MPAQPLLAQTVLTAPRRCTGISLTAFLFCLDTAHIEFARLDMPALTLHRFLFCTDMLALTFLTQTLFALTQTCLTAHWHRTDCFYRHCTNTAFKGSAFYYVLTLPALHLILHSNRVSALTLQWHCLRQCSRDIAFIDTACTGIVDTRSHQHQWHRLFHWLCFRHARTCSRVRISFAWLNGCKIETPRGWGLISKMHKGRKQRIYPPLLALSLFASHNALVIEVWLWLWFSLVWCTPCRLLPVSFAYCEHPYVRCHLAFKMVDMDMLCLLTQSRVPCTWSPLHACMVNVSSKAGLLFDSCCYCLFYACLVSTCCLILTRLNRTSNDLYFIQQETRQLES